MPLTLAGNVRFDSSVPQPDDPPCLGRHLRAVRHNHQGGQTLLVNCAKQGHDPARIHLVKVPGRFVGQQ